MIGRLVGLYEMSSWYKEVDGGLELQLRVQPNASSSGIVGVLNGRLKVRIQQPAVDGGANEALIKFFAKQLKSRKSAIRIIRGHQIREKTIALDGVSQSQLSLVLPFFDI